MKTASHFTYHGPGRIVISRGSPRGVPAGYKLFKLLAPSRETLAVDDYDRYLPLYMAQLALLDPQKIWDQLHLVHPGVEPVIQCYERPPLTKRNFCHRRMVAQWFFDELGHDVPEHDPRTNAVQGRLV